MTNEIIHYTKDELKQLSDEEFLLQVKSLGYLPQKFRKACSNIIGEVKRRTDFLAERDIRFEARLYCLEHGLKSAPLCKTCGKNPTKWNKRKKAFGEHCCYACMGKDKNVVKRREETCIRLHGVKNMMQLDETKNKLKRTCEIRYGVSSVLQSKEIREQIEKTCELRYGCKHPCQNKEIQEKMRQTMINRHGVTNPYQIKEVREKAKATCRLEKTKEKIRRTNMERHGGIGLQSQTIRRKMEETMLERHGVKHALESKVFIEKAKQTTKLNFDVEHPLQNTKLLEKSKATCLANHGVEHPLQSQEIFEKMKRDNLEKHGVEFASQLESTKQQSRETCKERFGVEYSFQAEEVKEKIRETCERKYGVPYYSQSKEFASKAHKPYVNPKYPDMTFGSSWEFLVYDFLTEHDIQFEYQPTISIPYEYKETHHTYHPDFRTGDKIIEVKGDNFFRINEKTGTEEMYCPYRDKDWTDEFYNWKCGLYEAKHQCMLANNVIILREQDIKNL